MRLIRHFGKLLVVRFVVAQYYNTGFAELCPLSAPQTAADLKMKTGR